VTPGLQPGYLVFEARQPADWSRFFDAVLGPADDLHALGLHCATPAVLAQRVQRLRDGGVAVTVADAAQLQARRVHRMVSCTDPAGNAVEMYCGPEAAALPFLSEHFAAGFHPADAGLGHAALVAHELPAMEAFYAGLLGFGVTERLATRVGPIDCRGVFLHCNARPHSLALFDLPLSRRLHHFMLQARQRCDVGRAYERARREGVPLSLSLRQHPEPDATFSFYGATPSGFDFEIGAGTQEITPMHWRTQHTQVPSTWGHRPSWQVQWQVAVGLACRSVARRFRGPARR
jgi:2,3-dihydroxybiphenyl 1,2-dioxygenase